MSTLTFNPDGWCHEAVHYTIRPRKSLIEKVDENGQVVLDKKGQPVMVQEGPVFTPVRRGLHPFLKKTYGTVRGCKVHCTDVIVTDAGKLAKRTAEFSPRKSSYTFLIGLQGDLHQLASIYDGVWDAGRGEIKPGSAYFGREVSARTSIGDPSTGIAYVPTVASGNRWLWPVVDGRVVINPNNWGPGIEIMGKPGRPTSKQEATLAALLRGLYAYTKITPDTVWAHGDLDPLHRTDPGFDVAAFAQAVHPQAIEDRETDGWNAQGDETEGWPPNPASGPGEHP